MKILFEIAILIGLNLFLFGYVQRKMAILIVAQRISNPAADISDKRPGAAQLLVR